MVTAPRVPAADAPAAPVLSDAAGARLAAMETELTALRAELGQARRILEAATEYAIISLDPEGAVTSWNAGANHVLGYLEAEILGHSGEIFFTAEARAEGAFARELSLASATGRATNERWHLRKDGTRFWASGVMLPLLDGDGRQHGFLNIMRDGTDTHTEAQRRALVEAELIHRVRNTFSLAHALAVQSQRNAETPEAFLDAFGSRLRALGRSHEMLVQGGWDGAPLRDVIARALAPYEGPSLQIVLDGPSLQLSAAAVVSLSLVFHELATNAAKYGGLSVAGGGVRIAWAEHRTECGKRMLGMTWREHDGPRVRAPSRKGFGSRMLEHNLRQEFGCKVSLDFAPAGLECRIDLPLTANVLRP